MTAIPWLFGSHYENPYRAYHLVSRRRNAPLRCPSIADLPLPPPNRSGWPWTEDSPRLPDTMPNGSAWPLVSIVTPSYNQGQFIEETIRSVLLQGYPNLEYVVIDGGSTDGTLDVIRKYEPWLTQWVSEPDNGQADAIGKGFALATGELLAWLNSDDCYLPEALPRVASFFSKVPDMVFASGDVLFVDANGIPLKRIFAVQPIGLVSANLGVHRWPQQGCFWRRAVYEDIGGIDKSLRFCMDFDLFVRLASAYPARCHRLPGPPIGTFRLHDEAKSSTILDVAETEKRALIEKYGRHQSRLSRGLLKMLWILWRLPAVCRATAFRFRVLSSR